MHKDACVPAWHACMACVICNVHCVCRPGSNVCLDERVYRNVYRHVHGHVFRHVDGHVCRHLCSRCSYIGGTSAIHRRCIGPTPALHRAYTSATLAGTSVLRRAIIVALLRRMFFDCLRASKKITDALSGSATARPEASWTCPT